MNSGGSPLRSPARAGAAYADTFGPPRSAPSRPVQPVRLEARSQNLRAALGYQVGTPSGRVRLHLAPAMRRIHLSGNLPWRSAGVSRADR